MNINQIQPRIEKLEVRVGDLQESVSELECDDSIRIAWVGIPFLACALVLLLAISTSSCQDMDSLHEKLENLEKKVADQGQHHGQLWRTDRVTGSVEVIHIGGRTAIMPVKDAWVNIHEKRISIGARCDQPVLDGVQQRGYFMPTLRGELNKDHRNNVHTITKKQVYGWGDDFDIHEEQTATVKMQNGGPVSLAYRSVARLRFDPVDLLLRYPGLADQLTEALQGFDKHGFRRLSFDAQF